MLAAGVRAHAATSAMPRRVVRARAKQLARRIAQVIPEVPPIREPVVVPVMACAAIASDPGAGVAPPIDWSRPFG